jgi:2-keto-4-pentenoate hydratase/2-oxohepta-3-ene-1,7-dioic acid hydratase in catechol pathway
MGSDPTREPPFFFQMPTDAIHNVAPGSVAVHPYPTLTKSGPVVRGDVIECHIDGLPNLSVKIV